MAQVYSISGIIPVIDPSAFVHPTAVLIGDVIVGAGCYVGPCASLRGDFGRLILEAGSNLQDNCVVHSFPGEETIVESNGHIGHGAILHGCRIGRNCLVGINAVVMDGAVIGESSMIGALAYVRSSMVVPPRSLVIGIPGKVIRQLTDQELEWKASGTALYQALARRSAESLQAVEPLNEPESGRRRHPRSLDGSFSGSKPQSGG